MSAAVLTARRGGRIGVQRERREVAYPLLVGVVALTAIGVVMVYSASSVRSYISTSDPGAQGMQQAIWAVLGIAAMYLASRTDFRHLRYLAIPIFIVTIFIIGLLTLFGTSPRP